MLLFWTYKKENTQKKNELVCEFFTHHSLNQSERPE